MTARASLAPLVRAAAAPPCASTRLQVRSIDAVFLRVLQQGAFDARVHSVFDRVVNLEAAGVELFTLAARGLDNAPRTAIVDIAGFGATGIAVGDPVTGVAQNMHVGSRIVVQWAAASAWRACLPGYAGAAGGLPDQLRAARSYLASHGARGGMAGQGGAQGTFADEVSAALEQRSHLLLTALARRRFADACRHAQSMLGLGPGLTPSGDDFLVGLFAVLNVAGSPCHGWLGGGMQVLLNAGQATNAISLAALTTAAGGRVRESIAALIDSLMHGTPATLVEPLQRVLAMGATSGADIVAGTLAGLELNLRVEANHSAGLRSRTPVALVKRQPIQQERSGSWPSKW